MITNNDFKNLRILEIEVNKHLYRICGVVTVITMAMVSAKFFSRGDFPSVRIAFFYLGVLIMYSLHKELVRWLGERSVERQGEYFVYGWIVLTALLYVVNFLSKDLFVYSPQGVFLTTLRETCVLTLEILAIFLITRGSKLIKIFLIKSKNQ
jgi:hypothetical protein